MAEIQIQDWTSVASFLWRHLCRDFRNYVLNCLCWYDNTMWIFHQLQNFLWRDPTNFIFLYIVVDGFPLWYFFQCTSIFNSSFCIFYFATEVQQVFFSLGGFLSGESVGVDEAVSGETIPMGVRALLGYMQRRARIWKQGLMLSSYVNFSARIASRTLIFVQRQSNFTVFSRRGSSSALLPAMLQAKWSYFVAKFLVSSFIQSIITQVGGMAETWIFSHTHFKHQFQPQYS